MSVLDAYDLEEINSDYIVELQTDNGSKIYLLGTKPYDEQSVNRVSDLINNIKPAYVFLQLDESRRFLVTWDEEKLLERCELMPHEVKKLIRNRGFFDTVTYLFLLKSTAYTLVERGSMPAKEYRTACRQTYANNGNLFLGDIPLHIMMRQLILGLSPVYCMSSAYRAFAQPHLLKLRQFFREKLRIRGVKPMPQIVKNDIVEQIEAYGEYADPYYARKLVAFRCLYFAHVVKQRASRRRCNVVCVVDLAYLNRIKAYWDQVSPDKIDEILDVPNMTLSDKIFTSITLVFCFLMYKLGHVLKTACDFIIGKELDPNI